MTSSARITSSKGNQNKWCENGKMKSINLKESMRMKH